jgi:hypothetical protein
MMRHLLWTADPSQGHSLRNDGRASPSQFFADVEGAARALALRPGKRKGLRPDLLSAPKAGEKKPAVSTVGKSNDIHVRRRSCLS